MAIIRIPQISPTGNITTTEDWDEEQAERSMKNILNLLQTSVGNQEVLVNAARQLLRSFKDYNSPKTEKVNKIFQQIIALKAQEKQTLKSDKSSSKGPPIPSRGEKPFIISKQLQISNQHRDLFTTAEIERTKKRELIRSLPQNEQKKIQRFSKSLISLKIKFDNMYKLSDQKQAKTFSDKIGKKITAMSKQYRGFISMYVTSLLHAFEEKEAYFYFERTRNNFINKYLYFYEIHNLLIVHKKEIIEAFLQDYPTDQLESIKFAIALKDIVDQKVIEGLNFAEEYFLADSEAETHHCGKSPAFIYFYKENKILFKVVYKPRKAEIDCIVIETFKSINQLKKEQKSGNIDLPEYKIMNFQDLDISIWEYVDGTMTKEDSVGAFIAKNASIAHKKDSAKWLAAEEMLNRLDAILTKMAISDLHGENVKIKFTNDLMFITPIDLENRQKNASTQLEGNPNIVQLTTFELEIINNANLRMKSMPFRYIPVNTQSLAMLFFYYNKLDKLVQLIHKQFEFDQVNVTMSPGVLKINILISLLNDDIPYFTIYLGTVYYGMPKDNVVIGNIRGEIL